MKTRIWATLVVVILLTVGLIGLRHIDKLNDGIKLKEIEIQDNSVKLKLLDKKYDELNKDLEKTGADKQKLEQDLQNLQEERLRLEKALQAKVRQKEADRLAQAQKAVKQAVSTPKAYASSCDSAKACIYQKESGNNPGAINKSSGACGLGQAWPCGKMKCSLSDYACQDAFFTNYAVTRYGSWEQAWAFWQNHRWW